MMKLYFLVACLFIFNSAVSASLLGVHNNDGQRIREMLLMDAISTNNNPSITTTATKQKDLSDTLLPPDDNDNSTTMQEDDLHISPENMPPLSLLIMSTTDANAAQKKKPTANEKNKKTRSFKESNTPPWAPLQFKSDDDDDVVVVNPSDNTMDQATPPPAGDTQNETVLMDETQTPSTTSLSLPLPIPSGEESTLSAKDMTCNVFHKTTTPDDAVQASSTTIRCYALNLQNINFEKSECSTTTEGHVFCEKNVFK